MSDRIVTDSNGRKYISNEPPPHGNSLPDYYTDEVVITALRQQIKDLRAQVEALRAALERLFDAHTNDR